MAGHPSSSISERQASFGALCGRAAREFAWENGKKRGWRRKKQMAQSEEGKNEWAAGGRNEGWPFASLRARRLAGKR